MRRRTYLRTLVASGTVATGVGTDALGPSVVQSAQAQSDGESAQQAKLVADDGDDSDAFGRAVAVSSDGTTALIGAHRDEDPNGEKAGSAYVFSRDGDAWSQQTKLTADDGAGAGASPTPVGDFFGFSVAVSGDGTTALIGAVFDDNSRGVNVGSAYVFSREGDAWSQQTKLIPDDGAFSHKFGASVAVSSDGTTALIGAPTDSTVKPDEPEVGSAYVFSREGDAWSQHAKLIPDDGAERDLFGDSVAVSGDSTTAVIGAYADDNPNGENAGSAYVFSREGGSWSQQAKLTAADGDEDDVFGRGAAVSGDGTTAVIGANGDENPNGEAAGSAYVFSRDGASWSQQAKLVADDGDDSDEFGDSVAVSGDGTTVIIGADNDEDPNGTTGEEHGGAGSAYVFSRDGASWIQHAKLAADDGDDDDQFGFSVAVSSDGTTALISAVLDEDPNGPEAGSAYVFDLGTDETNPSSPPDVTGDGNAAQDPDGDGLFEDVNGDGETTPGDATVLFNNVFEGNPAVTENVSLFDFNSDGSVTPGDATALFNELF